MVKEEHNLIQQQLQVLSMLSEMYQKDKNKTVLYKEKEILKGVHRQLMESSLVE